jgi:hypothetical protein
LQVYDSKTWTNKLDAIQKHLNERILSSALVDDIMIGEWKKCPNAQNILQDSPMRPPERGQNLKITWRFGGDM